MALTRQLARGSWPRPIHSLRACEDLWCSRRKHVVEMTVESFVRGFQFVGLPPFASEIGECAAKAASRSGFEPLRVIRNEPTHSPGAYRQDHCDSGNSEH